MLFLFANCKEPMHLSDMNILRVQIYVFLVDMTAVSYSRKVWSYPPPPPNGAVIKKLFCIQSLFKRSYATGISLDAILVCGVQDCVFAMTSLRRHVTGDV